jgi:TolB-like protein
MSDIFVSYKRENLAAVGRLVESLRAEGIGVWWDQDISPNAAWEATIEQALAAAKLVIVAWSPVSVASENVKAEARWARAQGRLLQVFIEACEPPLFFGERQGVDLTHWSGAASDAAFLAVLGAVREGLKGSPLPEEDAVPTGSLPLPSKPSIAVMPFANVSGDPEQAYFADGMLLEIVEALSRIKSIFVIASGSSLSFKGKGVTAQEAARQLGVRYVLEGSVRKAGNRVRIGVQLVDAADGASIWTERFEDTFDDVFALQDRVALAVAGRIEPTVQMAEIRRASARPTENMGSYDLYLRASAISAPPLKAELLAAIEQINRAIALDPDFGPALGFAALSHWLVVAFGWSNDPAEDLRQSVELAHRALKVSGDDAQVLTVVVQVIAYVENDFVGAIGLIDRALALNPGSAGAWSSSAGLRLATGNSDLAVEHIETSIRLDPLGPNRLLQMYNMGNARFAQGRFSEALPCFKENVQRQPENPINHLALAANYAHLGQTNAAREALGVYRTLTSAAPSDSLQRFSSMSTPEILKRYLDGIALAEGDAPTDAAGGSARP